MQLGSFRLGLRTLKTGLAVMLVAALFVILHRGSPMIAALAAVFALRSDFETTLEFGKSRIIGNAIGGAFAILYYLLFTACHRNEWSMVILLPVLLMVLISLNDGINNNKGLIGSVAAFLMIALTIPTDATYIYALQRVFDTFIGTVAAIIMNIGVHPTDIE